jgi:trimeric autotransporter adhesin
MKKFVLFIAAAALSNIVSAQFFYFNGTSYTQTFDNISTGTPSIPNMPVEWTIYTDATSNALGTPRTLLSSSKGTQYHWKNTTGGFKDVASADGLTASTDSATQLGVKDRALAVRQVSTSNANFGGSDPGAAFVLRVANTKNLSTIKFEFELQSLDDTSHRQTEWAFEYATGNNPTTFTAVTTSPASLVTGGDIFSNVKVTGTMPAAIDNSTAPVYFRLRSLSAAMPVPPNNGGNRATTAIDDFKLTWTGTAVGINDVNANNIDFNVLGTPLSNKVVLGCTMEQNANYDISIFDMTGKKVHVQNSYYATGTHIITIDNVSLNTGMYIVKMSSANTCSVARFTIQ